MSISPRSCSIEVTREAVDDHRARTARQGVRAERRRRAGPPRRTCLVDDLARSGELLAAGGRHVDDPPPARAGADDDRDRRSSERARSPPPSASTSLKQARREIGREIKGSLTQEQREALETITGPGGVTRARRPRRHRQGRRDLRRRQGVAAGGQRGDRHRDRRQRPRSVCKDDAKLDQAPTPPTACINGVAERPHQARARTRSW